jgi:hypothetical protein
MNEYQYFPYFVTSLSEMLCRLLHKPLSNFGVHENWCSESHLLVGGISESLPLCVFHPVWKKYGAGNVHEGVLSESTPGNQPSESHTVIGV